MVKAGKCLEETNDFIKTLQFIENNASVDDSKLASKYRMQVEECKNSFASCFYEEMTGEFGCSCPMFFIAFGSRLKLKKNHCTKHDVVDLIPPLMSLRMGIKRDFEKMDSYLSHNNISIALKAIDEWFDIDRIMKPFANYEICTCIEDECNTHAWTKSSLQCYKNNKNSEKEFKIPKSEKCSDVTDNMIKELRYVEKNATDEDSKLASKYLKLVTECLEKFDSCFYDEWTGKLGCSCPLFYIFFAQPSGFKKGDCKVLDNYEIEQYDEHFKKTSNELSKIFSYLPKENHDIQIIQKIPHSCMIRIFPGIP